MSPRKTLVIVVNYKSAELTLRAVRSVMCDNWRVGIQVVVVENSGISSEAADLKDRLPRHVDLIVNDKNVGFGRACNQAASAYPCDQILLLNPDAILVKGALQSLDRTLAARKDAAAVGPMIYWDLEKQFLLPPSYAPFLFLFANELSGFNPQGVMKKMLGVWWRRYATSIWRATRPRRVWNLSGGHVLIRTAALKKVGGLFDPQFFLYFEDADLFWRLRKAGYTLWVDPNARVIHQYDHCAQDEGVQKRAYMTESLRIFVAKHGRKWHWGLKRLLFRMSSIASSAQNKDLTTLTRPFSVNVPPNRRRKWLFELSPSPDFIPAIARFGSGEAFCFPSACWNMLAEGTYFGRLGAVTIGKSFSLEIRVQKE